MAVDMFMKITTIDGETNDKVKVKTKEIDVLAWSWGLSQSGTTHMGEGGGSGKVNVQDLSFTKYVDSSSNALILGCCKGTHFDKATLTVRKAGGTPVEYIVREMEEVIIAAVSSGGSGGEDRLTENVTLNFARFNWGYRPQTTKGAEEALKPAQWDIAANAQD